MLTLLCVCVDAETPLASAFSTQMAMAGHPDVVFTASAASGEIPGFVFALDPNAQQLIAWEAIEREGETLFRQIDAHPELPGLQGFRVEATGMESLEVETTATGPHRIRLITAPNQASSAASQSLVFDPAQIGTGHPFRSE